MISNERPSPYGHRSHSSPPYKPAVQEDTIRTDKIQIERKLFFFTLKENPRGRFLRITEDVNGRKDSIIVPASGLEDFEKLLQEMIKQGDGYVQELAKVRDVAYIDLPTGHWPQFTRPKELGQAVIASLGST